MSFFDLITEKIHNKYVLVGLCAVSLLVIAFVFLMAQSSKTGIDPMSQRVVNIVAAPTYANKAVSEVQTTPTPNIVQTASQAKAVAEAIAKQSKVDRDYADWQKTVVEEYPWRKKLPLVGRHYYVYFDLEKKVFTGLLYPAAGDNPDQMKREIEQKLQDMGIKTIDFTFKWVISG